MAAAFLIAMVVIAMKLVARGTGAHMRGPDHERRFQEWRNERERAAVPNQFASDTYAAPDAPRRMRRRVSR